MKDQFGIYLSLYFEGFFLRIWGFFIGVLTFCFCYFLRLDTLIDSVQCFLSLYHYIPLPLLLGTRKKEKHSLKVEAITVTTMYK